MRFRQIHLDFHTSEKIPGVGSRFSKAQFQEMLQLGHVDSITVFSKCHHGLSYHDTTVGTRHPHMKEELLPLQLEACREMNVKTPIYVSAGLDEITLQKHPEWGVRGKNGAGYDPLRAGFKGLCFNTPYLDYLCAQLEEVAQRFDDGYGFFIDIISPKLCYCNWCMDDMLASGLRPEKDEDAQAFSQVVFEKYLSRTTASCKVKNPDERVFHNMGHIPKGSQQFIKWNSHLELESLPTGGWGYDHFPLSAKYAATTGYQFLGMTGKFHTTWGEFGGFKRADALRYECAAMLAFGSKCSVGDQLHPNGEMNRDTYALIGAAYEEVEAKEPWCREAVPVSEIAMVSPEALHADRPGGFHQTPHAEEGTARMLLEAHLQFDVIDLDRDLTPYRLVILPDEFRLSGAFADKVRAYLAGGGKLILSGDSGLQEGVDEFIPELGLKVAGRSEWDPDYIQATDALPSAPVRGRFVIHGGAWNVEAGSEWRVLAHRADPYFNRTYEHFCSHQHTPDAGESPYPAVISNGQVAYFSHHIFTRYRRYGQPLYRDLVIDTILLLLGKQSVSTNLPSTGRASLMRQPHENRYLLHLLYATPTLRGGGHGANAWSVEVIEDNVPLDHVECIVRVPEDVKSVRLAPSGEAIDWKQGDGAVRFTVARLLCHQIVELGY